MQKKSLLAVAIALAMTSPMVLAQDSDMNATDKSNGGETAVKTKMKKRKHMRKKRMRKFNIGAIKKVSNLSEDQSSKLDSIESELQTSLQPLHEQMKSIRDQLRSKRMEAWDKATALLNDEQKAELDKVMESRKNRSKKRMQKRMKRMKKMKEKRAKKSENLAPVSEAISKE